MGVTREGVELHVVDGMGAADEAVGVQAVLPAVDHKVIILFEEVVEVVAHVTPGIAGVDADVETRPTRHLILLRGGMNPVIKNAD
jgi:hypothetical protein